MIHPKPLVFHVMHEDLGDEVVLVTYATFKEAQAAIDDMWNFPGRAYPEGIVPEKLSVWSNYGGMLAWRNEANGWVYNVRACAALEEV